MTRTKLRSKQLLVAASVLTACVDTEPLAPTYPEQDAGFGDALLSDGSVDTPCRGCMTADGGPCWSIYERCFVTELCPELSECFFNQRCYEVPNFEDRVACAIPCVNGVGIRTGDHPALQIGLELNVCSLNNCAKECGSEDF